ncbi:SAVED domain-containing protein [Escherichia coli]|nr:SAVED domain-containing protein [Escherichia coli]
MKEKNEKKAIQYFDPYSNESSNVRERFVRIIAYNEESYKSKIAIDDESPLSIHLDHFKKITSALLKKK